MQRNKYMSRYDDKSLLYQGYEILEILEQNTAINNKLKTVFYIKKKSNNNKILCIYWGKSYISVGDIVNLNGRLKNDTLIVWSMWIVHKRHKEDFSFLKERIKKLQ